MKKVKALIMTAVLVVGFTSIAGAASAANPPKSPCGIADYCIMPV